MQANYAPRHITAVELGEQAFSQALRSVSENGYEENIEVIRGDIREIKKNIPHPTLDLAACNPPYKAVGAGLRNPDERWKTRGTSAPARLKMSRKRAETCCASAAALPMSRPERLRTQECFRSYGLEPKRLRLVQQRINTAPSLFLLEVRRGGKPGLSVLPTLIIEDENGGFSAEMLEIYGNYKFGHEGGRADGRK